MIKKCTTNIFNCGNKNANFLSIHIIHGFKLILAQKTIRKIIQIIIIKDEIKTKHPFSISSLFIVFFHEPKKRIRIFVILYHHHHLIIILFHLFHFSIFGPISRTKKIKINIKYLTMVVKCGNGA